MSSSAKGRAIAAALGISGVGSSVNATTVEPVHTFIGGATVSGDGSVTTKVRSDAFAEAQAFTVSLLGSAGIVEVNATDSPVVSTVAAVLSTGGNSTVETDHNYDGGFLTDHGAHASTSLLDASLVITIGLANVTAQEKAAVEAGVGANGTAGAPAGTLTINAYSGKFVDASVKQIGVGIGSFAGLDSEAKIADRSPPSSATARPSTQPPR